LFSNALTIAVALSLCGCVSTSMSAAEVRVPVLFGPVPCIGCTADAPGSSELPVSTIAGGARAVGVFLPLGRGVGWGEADELGISADRLLFGTPCRDDVRLSNLRAHAWQMTVPLLAFLYDVAIEAEAATVSVPGASCGPP
jgi:hypothetical protein